MGWVTSQEWQLGQERSVTTSNLWVLKENLGFLIVRHEHPNLEYLLL